MASSFEDLDVWKKSCRLSVRIYELLRDCRDYGMKDQMLRAAISITANIAEGSERKSIADFKRSIRIAQGSAAELRTQVYISRQVNIFSEKKAVEEETAASQPQTGNCKLYTANRHCQPPTVN